MRTRKVSLILAEDLLAEAREVVGPRGLSSYVNRALRRQLQHDRPASPEAAPDRVPGSAKGRLVVPDDFDVPLEDFCEEESALKPVHHTILDLEGSVRPQNRPEDFDSVRRKVAREQGRARGNSDA